MSVWRVVSVGSVESECVESGECGECRECVSPKPQPGTPIHHDGLMDMSGKTMPARVSV